jgi:hypothetical protein
MTESDNIEKFIIENRERFIEYNPPESHMEKFLLRLNLRLRHVISIVPHLVRVAFVTAAVFTTSVLIWNNFIRKDRDEISLGNKISLVIEKIERYNHN